jgi:predicted small lipoprotein YifL
MIFVVWSGDSQEAMRKSGGNRLLSFTRPISLNKIALTLMLVSSLLIAGCGDEGDPLKTPPDREENAEGFGAGYEIVMNRTPDLPDEPPHLAGDTLVAQVAYPGGCAEHEFRLGHEASRETTQLWLHHRAESETCSTRVYDEIRRAVPDSVLGRPTTLLLMPQDSVPYMLRMNR